VDSEIEKETITTWVKDEVKKLAGIEVEDTPDSDVSDTEEVTVNVASDESDDGPEVSGRKRRRLQHGEEYSSLFSSFQQKKVPRSQSASALSIQELEVEKFLNGKAVWNKVDHTSLGCMLPLYLKTNTPLPSSAAVERLFSLAGRLFVPLRASLNDETFKQLIFLRANEHLYDIDTGKATPLAMEGIGSDLEVLEVE
jgi:hypothetical protein